MDVHPYPHGEVNCRGMQQLVAGAMFYLTSWSARLCERLLSARFTYFSLSWAAKVRDYFKRDSVKGSFVKRPLLAHISLSKDKLVD